MTLWMKTRSRFRSLPVLMYHSISHSPESTAVAPEIFAEHCAALAQAGWQTLSLHEVETCFLEQRPFPPKSCLITFDDGYLDNWLEATPILERHGLRGVIFPVLSELEQAVEPRGPENALSGEERFCSMAELREMARRGVLTPAPHSFRHGKVAAGPEFTKLLRPSSAPRSWSGLPPYGVIWGMPSFKLGHALTTPAFLPSRHLLRLVRIMVPQEFDDAKQYLAAPRNRKLLLKRIRRLEAKGLLGRMESMEEYRKRLFNEFAVCRKLFVKKLGVAPLSFCWPWGDYNAVALAEARRAGFQIFFTSSVGANSPASSLHVRRFKVRNISGARLLWKTRLLSFSPLADIAGRWQGRVAA